MAFERFGRVNLDQITFRDQSGEEETRKRRHAWRLSRRRSRCVPQSEEIKFAVTRSPAGSKELITERVKISGYHQGGGDKRKSLVSIRITIPWLACRVRQSQAWEGKSVDYSLAIVRSFSLKRRFAVARQQKL